MAELQRMADEWYSMAEADSHRRELDELKVRLEETNTAKETAKHEREIANAEVEKLEEKIGVSMDIQAVFSFFFFSREKKISHRNFILAND